MDNKERYQIAVQKTMDAYARAIEQQDFIGCIKQIGVMEYLGVPDADYHMGFAYHMNQEFEKAIPYFREINLSSPWYESAMYSLAIDYARLGLYLELDELFVFKKYQCSPLEELSLRIQCLEHAKREYLEEHSKEIVVLESSFIPAAMYKGDEAEMFFNICSALSLGLVAAGECINQCSLYQARTGLQYKKLAETKELMRFLEEYKRWCTVLGLSKCLQIIKLPENIPSLSTCALADRAWEEKITIFRSTNYVNQIMQIIFDLCRPEMHSQIESYRAVERILESFLHIAPASLAQITDHYFNIIAKAYSKGDNTAAQYLGYVYSEILATGKDVYGLKARIDSIRTDTSNTDLGSEAKGIRLARGMSRKGHDAYVNALDAFRKTEDSVQGSRDYSALSLQFFRVLEIEYCEKLIIPLANVVDIAKLHELADEADEDWKRKAWHYDAKCLDKIKSGAQESFEIGAVRTLLAHIIGYRTQNDPCAMYIKPLIEGFLTKEGLDALQQKEMLDVIGDAVIDKYRIPGAHTGYLPYSTACESKEYVNINLQKLVTWFK